MSAAAPWRSLPRAELEREYSPSSMVASIDAELARCAAASAEVRARHFHVEHAYGPGPAQRLDLFHPGGEGAVPLHLFVHGGYWQQESKERACGAASGFLAEGAAFAALEYTLAPAATLEEIVEECRTALAWLVANAVRLGVDPHAIHCAGSSAGAHLVATLALTDWAARGLAANPVASATLLSGIYDLRPLVSTYVNDPLGLDEARAAALSPLAWVEPSPVPFALAWGECETREFKRQSRAMAAALRAAGNRCAVLPEIAGRNHFDLILQLGDGGSQLGRLAFAQLRGEPA